MKKLMIAAAAAASMAIAVPAAAQDWPLIPSDYWEVSAIKIDDGAALKYATHLAGRYRESQEFAKSQGWIKDYHILSNSHPREGEPHLYLITIFDEMVSPEEGERRRLAFQRHMQATTAQMQAASGERATYRKLAGDMLLRELKWRD